MSFKTSLYKNITLIFVLLPRQEGIIKGLTLAFMLLRIFPLLVSFQLTFTSYPETILFNLGIFIQELGGLVLYIQSNSCL